MENLKKLHIEIEDAFFTEQLDDIPLLKSVDTLLKSIDAKGLKLTQKGYLPTKVVKNIVEVGATDDEKRHLDLKRRFFEVEHISASLARVVAEVLKLTREQKGKLLLTKKGEEYLNYSDHQRYIILFNIMFGINLGYFDGYQEAMCVHRSSLIMLQLLRDKNRDFRTAEVYVAILLEQYPHLRKDMQELERLELDMGDGFDIYRRISELRLFRRLYLPLGLVEMQISKDYSEDDKYAKTKLLDNLIPAKHVIDKDLLFSKKRLKALQERIRQKELQIDLFEETLFLFAQLASLPTPPEDVVIELLMQKHKVIGTLREEYVEFYKELIRSVETVYDEFTQFDAVGANKEEIVKEYSEMVEGFATLVQTKKPFTTVQRLEKIPLIVFDILAIRFGMEFLPEDFILKLQEEFDEEFAMNVGHLVLMLQQLQKDAKKLKKNKPHFTQGIQEFMQIFFVIVLELRSRDL